MLFVVVLQAASFRFPTLRADTGGTVTAQQSAATWPSGYEGADGVGSTNTVTGVLVVEPEVAAGPHHVLEVVQGVGRSFSKGGYCWSGAAESTLCNGYTFYMSQIFNNGNSCDDVGDDRILYDPSSTRWFGASIHTVKDCSSGATVGNFADVVVSHSSDPTQLTTQNWKDYSPPISTCWDHPEIAVNDGNLILTIICATMLVYNKADLVNFVALRYQNFTPPSNCSNNQPYPVRNLGSTTRQYMICLGALNAGVYPVYLFSIDGTVPNATCCGTVIQLTTISPPKNRPVPYDSGIWSYANAPPIQQNPVDYVTFGDAISAVWSNNLLWFAATSACPDVSSQDCIRLTQFNASSNPPSSCNINSIPGLCQDFYFEQQGEDVFLPALCFDSSYDLGLVFDFSSSTINPSLGITGQAAGDASGTWTSPKILKSGETYQTNRRFSDYFGAGLDPTDPTLIWVAGGYILSRSCISGQNYPTCWASWVGSLRVGGLVLSANSGFYVDSGWSASTIVSLQATGGFAGTVTLSTSVSPSNAATSSILPSSLSVNPGGTSTATASVSDASTVLWPGSYTLSVNAQTPQAPDISLTVAITVLVTQFDFVMSASPSSISIQPEYCCATSGTSTLTLILAVGVVGPTATFSSTGQPSYMQLTYSSSPALVNNPPGTAVGVSFNIPAGGKIYTTHTYNVIITGTADGVSHSATVSVTVYFDCTRAGCVNAPSP